jgi:hypothetical protein
MNSEELMVLLATWIGTGISIVVPLPFQHLLDDFFFFFGGSKT